MDTTVSLTDLNFEPRAFGGRAIRRQLLLVGLKSQDRDLEAFQETCHRDCGCRKVLHWSSPRIMLRSKLAPAAAHASAR
jgi:hypothetical protein